MLLRLQHEAVATCGRSQADDKSFSTEQFPNIHLEQAKSIIES